MINRELFSSYVFNTYNNSSVHLENKPSNIF